MHIAVRDVAVRVRLARRVQRRPGADIAPAGIERHDHRVRGLLHDGVVDRVRRAGLEARRIDAREIQIRLRGAERRLADARHLRSEARELLQIAARAEHEHAAVPVVVAGIDELARALAASGFSTKRAIANSRRRSRAPRWM